MLASRLEPRLLGYGSRTLLLEEHDEEHTTSLCNEYREADECTASVDLYLALVGGHPGYIPVICPLAPSELEEWMEARITEVARAIVELAEPGERLGNLVEDAHRLIVGGEPALDKMLLRIGERLTLSTIAYTAPGLRFKPQLRFYSPILEVWRETRRIPTPREVLDEACRRAQGLYPAAAETIVTYGRLR